MDNKTILFMAVYTLVLAAFIGCSSKNSDLQKLRTDAVSEIDDIISVARMHKNALDEMKKIAMEADHNHDLIVQISEYISIVPYETRTLIAIAEIASEAKKECPKLLEVVELTILQVGRSNEIIELAKDCTEIEEPSDDERFNKKLDVLRSAAKYKSVDEALEAI